MTVPADEQFEGDYNQDVLPVDVRIVGKLRHDPEESPEFGGASFFTLPLIGGGAQPVPVLQRRPMRKQAHLRNNDLVNTVIFAENIAKLQATVPTGFVLAPGQIQKIEAQQPYYALALSNNAQAGSPSVANGAIAAGAGSAALALFASLTGFTITFGVAPTSVGTVTVSNVVGGPLTFLVPVGATSLTVPFPLPGLTDSGGPATVTLAGAGVTVTGSIVATGINAGATIPVILSALDEAWDASNNDDTAK